MKKMENKHKYEGTLDILEFVKLNFDNNKPIVTIGSNSMFDNLKETFEVRCYEPHPKQPIRRDVVITPLVEGYFFPEPIRRTLPEDYQVIIIDGTIGLSANFNKHTDLFDLSVPILIKDTHNAEIMESALEISKELNRGHIIFDNETTSFMLI